MTTHYIWDFANDSYLMEKDENGFTTAEYTNAPGQFGNLISQRRNGQTYFHHYDAQGSTRTVTDQSQNLVEAATFSAFGETVAKTSTITNRFGFKGALGYYANPETDDVYVRARSYQPEIARWLSRDAAARPGEMKHLYCYVENRPTVFSDPSGLTIWDPSRPSSCPPPPPGMGGICACFNKPAATPAEGIVLVCALIIVGIGIGLDRCLRKKTFRCTTKARHWSVGTPCYDLIFEAEGPDRETTKRQSWQACVDAGCHQSGRGGDCGHVICHQSS